MNSTLAITRPTTALPPTLQIALLGPVRVTSAGQAVTHFRTNKMRALLIYLAMTYPQSVQRTVLTHLLWHGYTEHSARLNLRQALARLRHALPLPDLLETDHQRVWLAVQASSFTCDALLFRDLVEACQRHEHKSIAHCAVCRPRLHQAAELYKGPFLENFPDIDSAPFTAWCEAQRAYFADLFAEVRAVLRAEIAPVGYLPPPLTSLIGRTTELAELSDKLQHPIYRCLTLIGPGGIGKTRLALALGAQVQAHFPDGVWLVELAALEQPPLLTLDSTPTSTPIANEGSMVEQVEDQIAVAIGAVLGTTFQGVNRPSAQVAAYLQDKAALLLLDNFEQLSAGSGVLLQLLGAAPRLRLVVTSRQRLPLHAQLVYTVDGLATPPVAQNQWLPVTQWLTRYPSVQLFVDRAQNAGFTLSLDAPTLAVIGELCRLVGGSPWAIKLAVTMLDRYSPTILLQAIQRDYRVLDGAWLDLPPRQRSAEAVLRSAWRLLTPREAALLARCAVFHGGFTTAAAQAVGDATPADLQALVQKSLLHPTGDDHFTLHELVRQFAAEQLAQDPAAHEAALARHAAYYIALLQGQETALLATLAAQEAVYRELENVYAAWRWSVAQGDLALLERGAAGLRYFHRVTGLYSVALQLFEPALLAVRQALATDPAVPADGVSRLQARVMCIMAEFYRQLRLMEMGERLAQGALMVGEQLINPAIQGEAYYELARLAQVRMDMPTMHTLAAQGYTLVCQADSPSLVAECLFALGVAAGVTDAAIGYFQEALHWLQGVTNRYLEAFALVSLGMVHFFRHDYGLAYPYLQEASAHQRLLRDREGSMRTLIHLGDLWAMVGAFPAAHAAYADAQAMLLTMDNPFWQGWLHSGIGWLYYLSGKPAAAYASAVLAQQTKSRGIERDALICIGHTLLALGDEAGAGYCYGEALVLPEANTFWPSHLADAHAGLAGLALRQNKITAALTAAEHALTILAVQGLSAALEPLGIYWTCVRVLRAAADPRAVEVLCTAYQILQKIAAHIEDAALRQSFLEEVAVNRALIAAAHAAGLEAVKG